MAYLLKMCAVYKLSQRSLAILSSLHCQQIGVLSIFNGKNCSPLAYNGFRKNNLHSCHLLSKANVEQSEDKRLNEGTGKPAKKKKELMTYITLIESDEAVTVTTLEDATKLALRRNLKLIKLKECDTKTERPVYQLMTTAQYLAEEKKSKSNSVKKGSSIKGAKLVSISSKINDQDIITKVNKMIKWLDKRYEVRIVISDDNGLAETVFDKIAEGVKDAGNIVQKRGKGGDLKFQLVPLKKESKETASSSSIDSSQKL